MSLATFKALRYSKFKEKRIINFYFIKCLKKLFLLFMRIEKEL